MSMRQAALRTATAKLAKRLQRTIHSGMPVIGSERYFMLIEVRAQAGLLRPRTLQMGTKVNVKGVEY